MNRYLQEKKNKIRGKKHAQKGNKEQKNSFEKHNKNYVCNSLDGIFYFAKHFYYTLFFRHT